MYDVVGAQAQQTINHYEIDTKVAIIMPQQLAEILNQTSNHFAQVVPQPIEPFEGEVTSHKGIKQWH